MWALCNADLFCSAMGLSSIYLGVPWDHYVVCGHLHLSRFCCVPNWLCCYKHAYFVWESVSAVVRQAQHLFKPQSTHC